MFIVGLYSFITYFSNTAGKPHLKVILPASICDNTVVCCYQASLLSDVHTVSSTSHSIALMLPSTLFVIVMYISSESRFANGKLASHQREAGRDENWLQIRSTKFWNISHRTVSWRHVARRMSRIKLFRASPTNFKKNSGILP